MRPSYLILMSILYAYSGVVFSGDISSSVPRQLGTQPYIKCDIKRSACVCRMDMLYHGWMDGRKYLGSVIMKLKNPTRPFILPTKALTTMQYSVEECVRVRLIETMFRIQTVCLCVCSM